MESYLNNNYYGNRSYGVAAAAQSYWKKDLKDLTLAQYAILAGIPKSPTAYDLVQNAIEEEYTDDERQGPDAPGRPADRPGRPPPQPDPRAHEDALGPDRAARYTAADFEAAKVEPVILADQAADALARTPLRVAGAQGARRSSSAASPSARRSTPAATR